MTKEAPQKIYPAMCAILEEVQAIGKDRKNDTQGFKYRGIDDVYNTINPLLVKHRVFMASEMLSKTREERVTKNGGVLAFTSLHMRYRFVADDGSFVATDAAGEGMDSGDKSANKAMAVAHKYALLQAFCIPTEDLDDPDKESHEVVVAAKPLAAQPVKQTTTPASTDRKQAAANWCYEARDHVLTIETALGLDTWAKKNAKAMDVACDLAPNAFKALSDAMHRRQADLTPMAAE